MAINHEKKLIFIHIPKTAGTSIYKSLGIKCISYENKFLGHKRIEDYKEQYKSYWNDYLKFTVVRNPISRFISAYNYIKMDESFWHSCNSNNLPIHQHYKLCNSLDINQYISYLYNDCKRHSIHTIPQVFFIENMHKNIEVDYIAYYENLNNDLGKIGINVKEKLNASAIKSMTSIQLTKKSKKLLYEMYEVDYNYFYPNKYEKTFSYS